MTAKNVKWSNSTKLVGTLATIRSYPPGRGRNSKVHKPTTYLGHSVI